MGENWVTCVKCGKPLDPLLGGTMSVGMTGTACMKCGLEMEREQQDKIDDFTRRADAKGLRTTIEMDGSGHAVLVASAPKGKSDDGIPAGSKHGDDHQGGHAAALGEAAAGEVPSGVPGAQEGPEEAEAEREEETEDEEPRPCGAMSVSNRHAYCRLLSDHGGEHEMVYPKDERGRR